MNCALRKMVKKVLFKENTKFSLLEEVKGVYILQEHVIKL